MGEIKDVLWAKKEEKDGIFYWLPLSVHLKDTANVIGLLWEHWLSEGQKRVVCEDKDIGKQIAVFIGAIHDIGKATPAFQIKKGFSNSKDLDKELLEQLVRGGFRDIDKLVLASGKSTPHGMAGEMILGIWDKRFKSQNDIGSIVGGHHGKPVDGKNEISDGQISAYAKNLFQSEKENDDIYKKWRENQEDILDKALEISGFDKPADIPILMQPAQALLLGLLTMADWIASNTHFFPLIRLGEDTDIDMAGRCEYGFNKWKAENKSDKWEPEFCQDYDAMFIKRFKPVGENGKFRPRDIQSKFMRTVDNAINPGLIILEAPMGQGKTEAALMGAEQLAQKSERSGLFFGLPTQATSNGIFPRIVNWIERLKTEFNEKRGLKLVHGKAFLNEDYRNLTNASNMDGDGEDAGCFVINQWFSGKKTAILDDFVVGTVDQLLMMALKQKHLALRHLGLSKKVVIIDEVHAYDAYMDQYLNMALEWLAAYDVPVILLSATLPKKSRADFVMHYLTGRGAKVGEEEMDVMMTDSYPLISYTEGEKVHIVEDFEPIDDKSIEIKYISDDEISDLLASLLEDGGNVGIIVNTVRRAQNLAMLLSEKFGEETVMLLHSSFIATDRIKKEQKLMETLGKKGKRPLKMIVVGTQVIEQSLDIDFDVMISDLAPMDLLIQRMGRLHRHDNNRPKKHKSPVLYVLGNSEELEFESGSEKIYGGYLLSRTAYFLEDSIKLPGDISRLVQNVYDENVELNLEENLKEKYRGYKKDYDGLIEGKKDKAVTYRLKSPVLKARKTKESSLLGWLKNPEIDKNEENGNSQVRDTADTIEVVALKKCGEGYTTFGSDIDISKQIDNAKIAKKIASSTIKLPYILSMSYNIDKTIKILEDFYIKNLKNWEDSVWLKGTLCAMFNEDNECSINNIFINYNEKYGLRIKEDDDAKV